MTTFYKAEDLPLATQDTVVEIEVDYGVKLHRKVMAGTRIPPDLVDAYNAQLEKGDKPATESSDDSEAQLEKHSRPELDEMARELGVDEPEKLPNKAAVITAIEAKQAE